MQPLPSIWHHTEQVIQLASVHLSKPVNFYNYCIFTSTLTNVLMLISAPKHDITWQKLIGLQQIAEEMAPCIVWYGGVFWWVSTRDDKGCCGSVISAAWPYLESSWWAKNTGFPRPICGSSRPTQTLGDKIIIVYSACCICILTLSKWCHRLRG